MEFLAKYELRTGVAEGDPALLAKAHVDFYKFYINFASRCDAFAFQAEQRQYLEECIDYLQTSRVTVAAIRQSGENLVKMLDSLSDLCVTWGLEKDVLSTLYAVAKLVPTKDQEEDGDNSLGLLKRLKNMLNEPDDEEDGRMSPGNVSTTSSESESGEGGRGAKVMTQYLLSDNGMDSHFGDLEKHLRDEAITSQMNRALSDIGQLQQTKYTATDNMIAKLKINVPIWNYSNHRVDLIDPGSMVGGAFESTKTVRDVVLQSSPDVINVGPFSIYQRNEVFVYRCLVNNCTACLTTSLDSLRTHVKFNHGASAVDWSCSYCDLVTMHTESQKSLDGALDHLAKFHSMKSTYALSVERSMENNKRIAQEVGESTVCPVNTASDATALFHCPVNSCTFSSNSFAEAFSHLSSISVSSFHCPYCLFITFSSYEFCKHVLNSHGTANYKCGHCLYRSVSKANLVFHQRDVHRELPNRIVGLELLSDAVSSYDCQAHNTFKPFVCGEVSCTMRTQVQSKFCSHLVEHHGHPICAHCKNFRALNIHELIEHLANCHNIGQYRCFYCTKAFNLMNNIESHLQEFHSSQYPYIVICQDFTIYSPSLRVKYSKSHKFDINHESIIVLSLDSNREVGAVAVESSSAVVIEEVNRCKLQLKYFMKNVNAEVVEVVPEKRSEPHIEETLDLTTGEEPNALEDIKPRLRLRNIEELMKNMSEPGTSKEIATPGWAVKVSEAPQTAQKPPVKIKVEKLSEQTPQIVEPLKSQPVVIQMEKLAVNKPEPVVAAVRVKMEQQKDDETHHLVIESTQSFSEQPVFFTAATIDDIPVDFDCDVADNTESTVQFVGVYADPTVTDPIIISDDSSSDEGEDLPIKIVSTKSFGTEVATGSTSATRPSGSVETIVAARAVVPTAAVAEPTPSFATVRKYKCSMCEFASESRVSTYLHLRSEHNSTAGRTVCEGKTRKTGNVVIQSVACPYCKVPGRAYETMRGFLRHHSVEHYKFQEIKCFLIFNSPKGVEHPNRILACNFCSAFCRSEEALWAHSWACHKRRLEAMKILQLKATVAFKKLVCPVFTCLEEYLEPLKYDEHLDTHESAIACKGCTYVADSMESFTDYHDKFDPADRLLHFFYTKTKEGIRSLANTPRYNHPLYGISTVILVDQYSQQSVTDKVKSTARKSTGRQHN